MSLEAYIERQKQINRNVIALTERHHYRFSHQLEEDEPAGDIPAEEPAADAGVATEPIPDEMGPEPEQGAEPEMGADAGADMGGELDPGGEDLSTDALADEMGADPGADIDPSGADTEIDVTELVNGTQEVSQKMDNVLQKIEMSTNNIQNIIQQVTSIEQTVSQMTSAVNGLKHQIELMRPPTEAERRKVVQQNSYPYIQNIDQATSGMKQTQTDLENQLSPENILNTYNEREVRGTF